MRRPIRCCRSARQGSVSRAGGLPELQLKLLPVHRQLFCEPSPAPTKWAMARVGLCGGALRLPMVPLADKTKAAVRDAMVHAGLVN